MRKTRRDSDWAEGNGKVKDGHRGDKTHEKKALNVRRTKGGNEIRGRKEKDKKEEKTRKKKSLNHT